MQYGTQQYPVLERYVEAMKKMRLEELLIESDAERMLIVKHAYDDVYAVVRLRRQCSCHRPFKAHPDRIFSTNGRFSGK